MQRATEPVQAGTGLKEGMRDTEGREGLDSMEGVRSTGAVGARVKGMKGVDRGDLEGEITESGGRTGKAAAMIPGTTLKGLLGGVGVSVFVFELGGMTI